MKPERRRLCGKDRTCSHIPYGSNMREHPRSVLLGFKDFRIELLLAFRAKGMGEPNQGVIADIALDLLPLILGPDFLAVGADRQKSFQNLDALYQGSGKVDLQGDNQNEDSHFDAYFTGSLAPGRCLIAENEVRQVQDFIGKCQCEKQNQDHHLPDENGLDVPVFHFSTDSIDRAKSYLACAAKAGVRIPRLLLPDDCPTLFQFRTGCRAAQFTGLFQIVQLFGKTVLKA